MGRNESSIGTGEIGVDFGVNGGVVDREVILTTLSTDDPRFAEEAARRTAQLKLMHQSSEEDVKAQLREAAWYKRRFVEAEREGVLIPQVFTDIGLPGHHHLFAVAGLLFPGEIYTIVGRLKAQKGIELEPVPSYLQSSGPRR